MKKNIFKILATLIFGSLFYYLYLPPINLSSIQFWFFIIIVLVFFVILTAISTVFSFLASYDAKTNTYISYEQTKEQKKDMKVVTFILSIIGIFIILIILINVINSAMFNASKYANRIQIDESNTFLEDIEEVDFTKLPLLDKYSTQKLGDRKMGEIPDLVSQFYVSDLYTQITFNNEIMRVTPLEYDGFFKYLNNNEEGVTGYITVNSVDGSASLISLDEGMKYMPSAYFSEDLMRKLRFAYPTEIFGEATFEIDEEGNPYWIVPTLKYAGIGLRTEVDGVITLDAVSGESIKYELADAPEWIDHVYPSDLIIEQVDDWGYYVNGFINSIFGQKGVVNTTSGYNYLTINNDVYLYTGITSVAADESNLGFILVNLRTKETNYYPVAGAEEYSAMSSAEGLVQEKGYDASFPLLINLNGRPTYLMSLKDEAGLVKMYAFVDVVDYQIVSVTESSLGIEQASEEYLSKIISEDIIPDDVLETEITVEEITEVIIDGNTHYFIKDEEEVIYKASIKVSENTLAFLKKGDKLKITYSKGAVNIITKIN